MEEIDYDVQFREQPVKLSKRPFVLRELGGLARDEYVLLLESKTQYAPDGKKVGIKDVRGLTAGLLKLCLFDVSVTPPVAATAEFIDALPARVRDDLYDRAQKLSELTTNAEAVPEGNVPAASGASGTASPPA